jgi:hypothetical protein
MAIAWLVFPLVLLAVSTGCGLLVERIAGRRLPGALLPSVGLGLVIVVAELLTNNRSTAGWTTPVVVVLAVAGVVLSLPRARALRPDGWATAAAIGVFLALAAPVVLSGKATFLGYFVDNDTAVHLALVDQLFDRGRDTLGLPASAFSYIIGGYLATNYPVGAHAGLGALRPLVGQDVAWVYQPYLAMLLALGAAALYELMGGVVRSRALRATCAFAAGQAGLVYAYYAEGSIKEIGAVWILAVVVALAFATLRERPGIRQIIPLAVASAAGLDVLNLAIAPWLAPPLAAFAVGLIWQRRRDGVPAWLAPLAVLGIVASALAYPAVKGASTFAQVARTLASASADLGNLVAPLQWWQEVGIWPSGDFRFPPYSHQQITFALIGVALASGGFGVLWMVRRRALAPLVFVATALVALLYAHRQGSPYVTAKAMMVSAPGVALAVMLGAVALWDAGRRLEGWLLAAAVTGGILWTNGLAYHDVNLAPRDRLAELGAIDDHYAGRGPTLYNQIDQFVLHYLRRSAGQVPGSGPPIQLRPGVARRSLALGKYPYDVNDFSLAYVESFPLIVLGRSPLTSRPPVNYRLARRGAYYDVWQRGDGPRVLEHVPFGETPAGYRYPTIEAGGAASCNVLAGAAQRAQRAGARLAYVEREALPVFVPARARRPPNWGLVFGDPYSLYPVGRAGAATGRVIVPRAGRYTVWAEGSFDRAYPIWIDGRRVGEAGPRQLGPPAQFVRAGEVTLRAGSLAVRVVRPGDNLAPGDGGTQRQLGPVFLQPLADDRAIHFTSPRDYRALCGRRLDWVEIVR